jgi:hypothetical protein
MFAQLHDTGSIGSASLYANQKLEELIAASTKDLAFLRYSISLTARWAASAGNDLERRKELHAELKDLRLKYSQKIDDIAITFGVQCAMNAKEEVERSVAVPLYADMDLFIAPSNGDDRHA